MRRKKEPKELIELLLRKQRANRPEQGDPLEGIEWGGLPSELRDRVYRPPEAKEPLVELLTSLESQKRGPERTPDLPAGPREPAAGIPPRPGFRQRCTAWFYDGFAFLNKSYEIRVATIVAFAIGALTFAGLCYLLGSAGRSINLEVPTLAGPVQETPIIAPEKTVRQEVQHLLPPAEGRGEKKPGEKPVPPRQPPPPLPRQPSSYAIAVTTVPSSEGAQGICEKICAFLKSEGYETDDPRVVRSSDGKLSVVVGRWKTEAEATRKLTEFQAKTLKKMTGQRLISNTDQFVKLTEN